MSVTSPCSLRDSCFQEQETRSSLSRSSDLADNSQQKGQAALFAFSRGRKEGEVEGDVIP